AICTWLVLQGRAYIIQCCNSEGTRRYNSKVPSLIFLSSSLNILSSLPSFFSVLQHPYIGAFIDLYSMAESSIPQDELTKLNIKLEEILLSHANLSNTLHDIANRTTVLETQPHQNPPPLLHVP
ncbi:hypothetical protein V8G54_022570, partial [Vigna mungo]